MATLASLNVVLNLQAAGMRAGLRTALQDYQQFANQVTATTHQITRLDIQRARAQAAGGQFAAIAARESAIGRNLDTIAAQRQAAADQLVNKARQAGANARAANAQALAAQAAGAYSAAAQARTLALQQQAVAQAANQAAAGHRAAAQAVRLQAAGHHAAAAAAGRQARAHFGNAAALRAQMTNLRQVRAGQQDSMLAARHNVQEQTRLKQVMEENHRVQRLFTQVVQEGKQALSQAAEAMQLKRRAVMQGAIAFGSFAASQKLVTTLGSPLLKTFVAFADIVGGLIGPTTVLGGTISKVFTLAGSLAADAIGFAGKAIGGAVTAVAAGIGTVFSFIGGMFKGMGSLASSAAGAIGLAFGPVGAIIGAVVGAAAGTLFSFLGAIPTAIGSAISAIGGAIGGAIAGVAQVLGEVVGKIAGLAGTVIGGVVDKVVSIGAASVRVAADFERIESSFTVLLGSATKAREVLEDLQRFAAVTPFQYRELAKEVQQLTAVGFAAKDAVTIVKKMGDVAAAMPGDFHHGLEMITAALATMKTKGTVQAREMTRLAHAGIPAWEALAAVIGKSVAETRKMSENGLIPAYQGIQAMLNLASDPRYAGQMEKQSKTVWGLWSTLKDNMELLMDKVGQAIIKGFDVKGAISSVSDLFTFLKGKVDELAPAITVVGTVIRTVFDVAVEAVKSATNAIAGWLAGLKTSPQGLQELKVSVVTALKGATLGAIKFGETVTNAIIDLINYQPKVQEFFLRMQRAAWGALEPFEGMVEIAMVLAEALGMAAEAIGPLKDKLLNIMKNVWLPFGEGNGPVAERIRGLTLDIKLLEPHPMRGNMPIPRVNFNPQAAGAGKFFDEMLSKMSLFNQMLVKFFTQTPPKQLEQGLLTATSILRNIIIRTGLAAGANFDLAEAVGVKVTNGFLTAGHAAAFFAQKLFGIKAASDQLKMSQNDLMSMLGKAITETRTPLEKFKEEMLALQQNMKNLGQNAMGAIGEPLKEAFEKGLRPLGGAAKGEGFAVLMRMGQNFFQLAKGADALQRQAVKNWRELRKAMGPSGGDVAAMEKGSAEAVNAINRAFNQDQRQKDDVPNEMQQMVIQEKLLNQAVNDLAQKLDAGLKKLGLR